MKIKIFKDEKGKPCFDAPGVDKGPILMFVLGLGALSAEKIKQKFGEQMPELDVQCQFDSDNKQDNECLRAIEMIEQRLMEVYK